MKDLYFITGFLGAGKTTFMRNLINEFKDKKLHIIINEFGQVGVDGKLFKNLGIALDEINNGSILCSCRMDKFASVLGEVVKGDSEVIIIEASGLTDPSNLTKVLYQFNFNDRINYKGCICLIDAKRFHKVYETAVVVKKQLYASDYIIINKSDLVEQEQLVELKNCIVNLRPDAIVRETSFGQLQKDWFADNIINISDEISDFMQVADITLKKYLINVDDEASVDKLKKLVELFLDETHRVKGFIKLQNETYYLDCVGAMFKMDVYHSDDIENDQWNKIVVLAGVGLNTRTAIKNAIKMYPIASLAKQD